MATPLVSINKSGAYGLTNITTCDSIASGWDGFAFTGPAPREALEQDIYIQGTAAVSTKISGSGYDSGLWYDYGSGIDFTVTGRHFYIWIAVTTIKTLYTVANNGIYIIVSSSGNESTDYRAYNVGGSDITTDARFIRYVIDLNKTPSRSTGSTSLSSVRYFGAGIRINGSAKSENLIIDRMDYGNGLEIARGDSTDPARWESLYTADNNSTNKYGIIEKRSGIYYLKGGITIGDPSGTELVYWSDTSGSNIRYEAPLYHNGSALVSSINSASLYKIEVVGNATGTTDVSFGSVVGTGDSRQGILGGGISSDGPKWTFDGETDISDIDTLNLYGVNFQKAGNIKLSGSTKTDCIGCTFIKCDEIQSNDAEFLNNTVIGPEPDRGIEFLSTHNIKQSNFVAGSTANLQATRCWQVAASGPTFVEMTREFNDAIANNCICFPATEAVNDYFAMGHTSKYAKLVINTTTARSGGALVWEYYNGSSWSSLTVTDGTNTLSTTGSQNVTWTPPTNWTAVSLNGEEAIYYVRLRVTTTMTTNPLIGQGWVTDTTEHHVHIPAAGSYTFEGMMFFGHSPDGAPKWHGENSGSSASVTIGPTENSNVTQAEFDNTNGGTTTVTTTPVYVTQKVTDIEGTEIENARVFLKAKDGTGPFPFEESITITRVDTTATVAHTGHGMATGDKVSIQGANQIEYTGVKTITVTGVNEYTYTVSGSPTTPATGTIMSTFVALYGLTNEDGEVTTSRVYSSDQPITGWAREIGTSPYYKSGPINGTVYSASGYYGAVSLVEET